LVPTGVERRPRGNDRDGKQHDGAVDDKPAHPAEPEAAAGMRASARPAAGSPPVAPPCAYRAIRAWNCASSTGSCSGSQRVVEAGGWGCIGRP
jgi:hypothetical protein